MIENANILLVDDDQSAVFMLQQLIETFGYKVDVAFNGCEAMDRVESENPDVILADVVMPVMDGFELVKQLRNQRKSRIIPILLITGLQDMKTKVRALEAGADDVLTKPINALELKAKLKSMTKVKAYNEHMHNYQKELEGEVSKATRQLRDALYKLKTSSLVTISRLAAAAEYKDRYTGRHLERISYSTAAIARKMGFDDTFVETIMYSSPMHDIGKIGIPDRILLKPGKLDPDEWEVMKSHTTIGGDLLKHSGSDIIHQGEEIALTHHERWDGSGYPRGLKGREIPVAGRITAIVDVFDALLSKRPYKEAFTRDKSLKIIEEGVGSHFDPEVAEAFFEEKDTLVAIGEHYQ